MEYKRIGSRIVCRIDRGEEICEKVKEIAALENIGLASISAIGATCDFEVGAYNVSEKKYYPVSRQGEYEIASLLGNLSRKGGEVYLHLHMVAAGADGCCVGGHLNRAVVSATCEMFIDILDGEGGRKYNPETGLNMLVI